MHPQKQRPEKQRRRDEILVPYALGNGGAGPQRDQVPRVEYDEELVVLVLCHLHILEDAHGAGLREGRLVEVDQEGDPPGLRQQEPEVLAIETLDSDGVDGLGLVLVAVVEESGVVDLALGDHV